MAIVGRVNKERCIDDGPDPPHKKGQVVGEMEWRSIAHRRRSLFLNYFEISC